MYDLIKILKFYVRLYKEGDEENMLTVDFLGLDFLLFDLSWFSAVFRKDSFKIVSLLLFTAISLCSNDDVETRSTTKWFVLSFNMRDWDTMPES